MLRKFYAITYTSTPDKYPVNPQLSPFNGIDKYLPIYGKFSDVLPKHIKENVLTPAGDHLEYHHDYGLNGDGYVTSKIATKTLVGGGAPWSSTSTYKYSSNWQGI